MFNERHIFFIIVVHGTSGRYDYSSISGFAEKRKEVIKSR